MNCPACSGSMREVRTSSHYGVPMILDQCGKCGGIWFDDSELYRTIHGEADRIEKILDANKLRKFADFTNKEMLCPADKHKLKNLKQKIYFDSLDIYTCPHCDGFWLNFGEFSKYQTARQKKLKDLNSREQALRKYKTAKGVDKTIEKQAIALVKMYGELEKRKHKEKTAQSLETILYILWTLIRILFRIP